MNSLYFLFPTLITILISFLFVRGAAIALMMTGMEKKKSRFQALSAFSGTGFTTKEAETVINHPVRRKIVTWLMILGNAGIVTVIVTATSSFATSQGRQLPINMAILVVGIFLVYKLMTYKKFLRKWEHFIENKLLKLKTFEEDATTEDLLHFIEGFGLMRKIVHEDSILVGSSLLESKLSERGILVLGIERDKSWIPIPKSAEILKQEDRLVVYGPLNDLKSLLDETKLSSV